MRAVSGLSFDILADWLYPLDNIFIAENKNQPVKMKICCAFLIYVLLVVAVDSSSGKEVFITFFFFYKNFI